MSINQAAKQIRNLFFLVMLVLTAFLVVLLSMLTLSSLFLSIRMRVVLIMGYFDKVGLYSSELY